MTATAHHAWQLVVQKRFLEALALFDELVTVPDLDLSVYCNALYAVQHDNHGQGVMPERAARYLAACLPYAPQDPPIYHNAGCVLLELGDPEGALSHLQAAKQRGYDIRKIRDDQVFRQMWADPGWAALIEGLDPPRIPLAIAEADPAGVRNVKLDDELTELPDLTGLVDLEVLEVPGEIKKLPAWVATLPKLRKLDLGGAYAVKTVSDEILAMPSLREVVLWWTKVPHPRSQTAINALLRGFAKTNPSREVRLLHLALLFGGQRRALAQAGLADLVAALDSNVAAVRTAARQLLEPQLREAQRRHGPASLTAGSEVLIVGTLVADRSAITERLTACGAALVRKRGPATSLVVLGDQHRGKALEHLDAGVPIVLEEQFLAVLDPHTKGYLADDDSAELTARLAELLTSRDPANARLAVELMRKGGVPTGLLEELLLVIQDSRADRTARAGARKLFAQHAPPVVQEAVRSVLARTSLFASGEGKLRARLTALGEQSDGLLDPVRLATLMLPKAGYTYLFAHGDDAQVLQVLRARLSGGKLDLSQAELSRVPDQVTQLTGVTEVDLCGNHLTELPAPVLELPDLVNLDVAYNSIATLPERLGELTKLRILRLSGNPFKEFPSQVLQLVGLRELELDAALDETYGLKELPPGIGDLVELTTLSVNAYQFSELPETMRRLTSLRRLDLSHGQLKELPGWVADLPALEHLDLTYVDLGKPASAKATVQQLRARGVQVDGV